MTIEDVVSRIGKLKSGEVRIYLPGGKLDWQASLSKTLRLWLREPSTALSDGELILA